MIQQVNSLTRLFRSQKEDKVHLGKIAGSFLRSEFLTESQLNHHTHIVGASGFGKTVLISHIVKQLIKQGKGLLFIDLKSDIDTIEKFTQYASDANRTSDLEVFTLADISKSVSYNLIADGTATQLRDRIILSLVWSEEYYKNQSSSFLLKLLILLCWLRDNKGFEFHLGTILECASSAQKVVEYGNQIPMDQIKMKAHAQGLLVFLNQKDNFNSLQGLRVQIESIVLSDFGDLIATSKSGIRLFEAYQKSKIVFLFLDSRRYGETAKSIGKFIL